MARMVNRIVKRVAKAVGVLALIAVAGLAVLLAALWVDHSTIDTSSGPQWPLQSRPYHVYLDG